MARMDVMQTELTSLRAQVQPTTLDVAISEINDLPAANPSRRRMLRRLAAGMLAGLAVGSVAAAMPEGAEAKIIGRTGRVGAVILGSGDSITGDLPGGTNYNYGLVVLSGTGPANFDLAASPYLYDSNAAIYARSSGTGVYASGSDTGVFGSGTYGVKGEGTSTGVRGEGTGSGSTGVFGIGGGVGGKGIYGTGPTGVYGAGIIGVKAESGINGPGTPALQATHTGTNGIAAVFANTSLDTTLLISNAGAGPLFKAWAGTVPKVEITNSGLIKANGGFQGYGADLAEFIPVLAALEPGDVVEIDPDNAGYFRQCSTPGSLAVAGVISTRPGVSLGASDPAGASGENQGPQLALAGRIPVKVTDEGGPIRPGDLLVASATPGHAMRAPSPAKQGSVLGKALGALDSGTGIVEMLVMLR
jgi:hypothetical protein